AFADLVDSDRDAVKVIASNLRTTGLEDRARVHPTTVSSARVSGPFELIFADPPYDAADAFTQVAELVQRSGMLGDNAVAVVEHRAAVEPPEQLGPLTLVNSRKHGGTRISLYAL